MSLSAVRHKVSRTEPSDPCSVMFGQYWALELLCPLALSSPVQLKAQSIQSYLLQVSTLSYKDSKQQAQ